MGSILFQFLFICLFSIMPVMKPFYAQAENQYTEIIQSVQPQQTETQESSDYTNGVSVNGHLKVVGTQLCNEKGEPIVLKGMSSHGIQWFGNFANAQSMQIMRKHGANLFRIAMYTEENGYLSQPALKEQVIQIADTAIQNDMYFIIDWHILSDGNPMTHLQEAKTFFSEMAEKYKDSPAVIYEICNEPNGNISWTNDVKPYAQELIQTIRAIDNDSVILVGSPTWSQDLHIAAQDPLQVPNIMYTCHFYAGTHTDFLRNRIDEVLQKGIPVFVSEWGVSQADGSNGIFYEETEKWLNFLSERKISWANWSLCNKAESSAALKSDTDSNGFWTEQNLSESGQLVFQHFQP